MFALATERLVHRFSLTVVQILFFLVLSLFIIVVARVFCSRL